LAFVFTGLMVLCFHKFVKFSMSNEEMLNIIQEVLRGIVIGMVALDPKKLPDVAQLLRACAAREEIDPVARHMLEDLAKGLELLGSTVQKH
jgi:hypothetical protein